MSKHTFNNSSANNNRLLGSSSSALALARAAEGENDRGDNGCRVTFHHPNPHYSGTDYPMADVAPRASNWLSPDMPIENDLFALKLAEPIASFVDEVRALHAEVGITAIDSPGGGGIAVIHHVMPSGVTGVAAFCSLDADRTWHRMEVETVTEGSREGFPE